MLVLKLLKIQFGISIEAMWYDGTLLSDEVAVGNCVIVNDFDCPCSRLIAVVMSVRNGIRCRYLNNDILNNSVVIGDNVTPIKDFGVEVFFKRNGGKIIFWGKQTGVSVARYKDGKERLWQDRGLVGLFDARPDVFSIADEAL